MPAPAHRHRLPPLIAALLGLAAGCGVKNIPPPPVTHTPADAAPARTDGPETIPIAGKDAAGGDDASADASANASSPDTAPPGPITCAPACGPAEICKDGQCQSVCHPGESLCKTGCSDVTSDPQNCGACEHPCAAGQFCSAGTCVMSCAGGETRCGGSCVKLDANVRNCGACGMACTGAQVCLQGVCTCAAPNQVCDGLCTSLNNNRDHCGACDVKCTAQLVCNGKACGCPGGRKECPNKPGTCVANLNDCCPGNQIFCGGALNRCIDSAGDKNHCGGCNTACQRDEVCRNGACGCPGGTRSCGGGLCIPTAQCCPGSEITCPGQSPGCRPAGECCNGSRRCGNQCVAETTCCDGQKPCTAGGTTTCIPPGDCCPGTMHCPDRPNACVADLAQCCGPNETHCEGGHCKPNGAGGCCGDGECGDNATCNLGNHRCQCKKACPNDPTKCTDATNTGCCPDDKPVLCGAKCIGRDQCCDTPDCRDPAGMGNRLCNKPTNTCVCPMGEPHLCDGDPLNCHECCGPQDCAGRPGSPDCGSDHRCGCAGTMCGMQCCPGKGVVCGADGRCPGDTGGGGTPGGPPGPRR